MKKRGLWLVGAILAVTAALAAVFWKLDQLTEPALSPAVISSPTGLILDAGHGGEDGGAVSLTGVPESHINLEIVLKMDDILGFYGTAPLLLRREDISLHDADAVTLREKKVSDLKNRVAAIQAAEGASLISIHQNSMPTAPKVHGAQVFYNQAEGSEALALAVQDALNSSVNQPDSAKTAKRIGDSIYLMKNVTVPAVLVECGFLSNPQETAALNTEAYQTKLAVTILAAALTHVQ